MRQEYIRLQNRLQTSEQENAILKACNHQGKNFISKLLTTVVNLYNKEQYSDVKIQLESSQVFAHKFILAIHNEAWAKQDIQVIDLSDVSQAVGEAISRWMYTNEVDYDCVDDRDSFALALMRKSKEFGLQDLMNKCQESLLASVQIHNCIRYYSTAEEIGAKVLQDHCSQLISTYWVIIFADFCLFL